MATLVDTNVLLRSLYPEHAHYSAAENAIALLRLRGEVLCIAPQNLVEFWAVATRSRDENGLGMTIARASAEIAILQRFFGVLPYASQVLEVWTNIVATQGITGKQTHDAHLAAVMKVNSIASILTFNASHFRRFPDITIIDPASIV